MKVDDQILVSEFLKVLDLVGTFAFALSGAVSGVKHRIDLFGVLVLSFAAATAGGIARDVLIGSIPPASIRDWRYITLSMIAGVVTFFWYPLIAKMKSPVQIFDALGLGLFAVVGAGKAIDFHLGPSAAVLTGVMTGIGGGSRVIFLSRKFRSPLSPNSTQSPPSLARPSWSSGTPFFPGPRL